MELVRGAQRRPEEPLRAGHVQVGFVDGGHFDQRRKVVEHFENAPGIFAITLVVAFDEDRVRAVFVSGAQRHRRMHAEFARFVGSGRYHAALVMLSAHDDSLANQRRIEQFFHRHKKRVHVDVENGFHDIPRNLNCMSATWIYRPIG